VNAAITISQNSEPLKLNAKDFEAQVVQAAELLSADKLNDARSILEPLLKAYPNNVDINQLYATLWLKSGDQPKLAIEYYEKAIRLPGDKNPAIYSNYLEALRADGRHEDARKIGLELLEKKMIPFSSLTCTFYLNLGLIEKSFLNLQNAYDLLNTAIQCDRTSLTAWSNLAEVLVQAGMFPDAEKVAREAIDIFPKEDFYLYYILGTALHHQKKLNGALNAYLIAESLNDKHLITKANIAAAFQGLGRAVDALYYYQQIIPLMPNDGGVRNNYGALLGTMNRKDEEIYWLEEALKLDPTMEHAMINLAGHYQDEGLLQKAGHYLLMAENNTMDRTLLRLRYALMLSPVPFSYRQVLNERMRIIHNLRVILQSPPKALAELDTTLDRIHFYLSYHGFNDRNFQQGIGEIYHLHIKDINYTKPSLLLSAPLMSSNSVYNSVQDFLRFEKRTQKEVKPLTTTKRKSRIGFISKFFGIFEPHGMLLDGVMKYLPKDEFEVICLLIARTDLKPPAPTVIESCNEVYEISLVFQHAMNIINSIPVDVLIFADVVSEPINHFLAFNRIAPIQVSSSNRLFSLSTRLIYLFFHLLFNRLLSGEIQSLQDRIKLIISCPRISWNILIVH
jgi:tetratricopeptide (TPR) repeat protein